MSVASTATTAERVLERGLSERFGRRVKIARLSAEALDSYSTHPIERLRVSLADGAAMSVIHKRLRPKPGKDIRREPFLYARVLAGARFGAPTLYASLHDEARGRHWLFLEDVGSFALEWCTTSEWEPAFEWLARMHAAFHGREDELRRLGFLPEHDASFYRGLAGAARRRLAALGERTALARFDALIGPVLRDAIASLAEGRRTFVHGDLSCTNLLVEPDRRIRAVDWEWAAIGPAAWDLGKLLAGWGPEKHRFVEVYRQEFSRRTSEALDRDLLRRQLGAANVVKALWYLRWWVARCEEPAFVDALLDKMERSVG